MWETWGDAEATRRVLAGARRVLLGWIPGRADPGRGSREPEPEQGSAAWIAAELAKARQTLEKVVELQPGLAPSIRAFRRIECLLHRPMRVAIIGEFNSGKSSLANLLARAESLPTSVISNTRIPTLIYHARRVEICALQEDGRRERLGADLEQIAGSILRLEVGLPSERLHTIEVLDFPGLADPRFPTLFDLARHNIDAVIWCTVSTQAWKESERAAWSELPSRLRHRGLLVSTHGDLLHDARDRDRLMQRLRGDAGPMFRGIVLLSTVDALALLHAGGQVASKDAWRTVGAEPLESELDRLLGDLREERAVAALRVTGRIADRALRRIAHLAG